MNRTGLYTSVLLLTLAACSTAQPTPKEVRQASFEEILEHAKQTGFCPNDANPIVMHTDLNGSKVSSKTYPERPEFGQPRYILLNDYPDHIITFKTSALHEIIHYCSLDKEEELHHLNISNEYGNLVASAGKVAIFESSSKLITEITVFEEAFAYYGAAQYYPNQLEGWTDLQTYSPRHYELALLASYITDLYGYDFKNSGYRELIETITGNPLNQTDMDIIEDYFNKVLNGQMSADTAMSQLSNQYPFPHP